MNIDTTPIYNLFSEVLSSRGRKFDPFRYEMEIIKNLEEGEIVNLTLYEVSSDERGNLRVGSILVAHLINNDTVRYQNNQYKYHFNKNCSVEKGMRTKGLSGRFATVKRALSTSEFEPIVHAGSIYLACKHCVRCANIIMQSKR